MSAPRTFSERFPQFSHPHDFFLMRRRDKTKALSIFVGQRKTVLVTRRQSRLGIEKKHAALAFAVVATVIVQSKDWLLKADTQRQRCIYGHVALQPSCFDSTHALDPFPSRVPLSLRTICGVKLCIMTTHRLLLP